MLPEHKKSNYVEGAFSDYNLAQEALRLANEMAHGVKNLNLTPPSVNPYQDKGGKWTDYYHGIVSLFARGRSDHDYKRHSNPGWPGGSCSD